MCVGGVLDRAQANEKGFRGFFFGQENEKVKKNEPAIPTAANTLPDVLNHVRHAREVRLWNGCVVRAHGVDKVG